MVKILHMGFCAVLLLCGCAPRQPVYYAPPPVVPASELTAQPVYETVPAPAPVLQPVAQPIEVGPVYYEQTTWGDPFWHDHPPVHYPGGHHRHHHDSHARQAHRHGPALLPPARSRGTEGAHPQHAVPRPHAAQTRPTPRPAPVRPAAARPATSRPSAHPAASRPPVRPNGTRPSGARPSGARPSAPRSGKGGRGRH